MLKLILSGILSALIVITTAYAQEDHLRAEIAEIAQKAKGTVGVAILGIEDRDTISYNGHAHLVMHSVMKFPIAITVLHFVDRGRFSLGQKIHISKEDLPKTYSPLRDKYPEANVDVTISELLSYMVSLSDNDACDILLKALGGTKIVDHYIHSLGINGISVKASESEMAARWDVQYTNLAEPIELVKLLGITYKGNVLSKNTKAFLWEIMYKTSTGVNRIKAGLPKGTMVAHKTGTSPTNTAGLSPATNDMGIINLPNGKHLAIAILVGDAVANEEIRESVIAKIAKAAWDTYSKERLTKF